MKAESFCGEELRDKLIQIEANLLAVWWVSHFKKHIFHQKRANIEESTVAGFKKPRKPKRLKFGVYIKLYFSSRKQMYNFPLLGRWEMGRRPAFLIFR